MMRKGIKMESTNEKTHGYVWIFLICLIAIFFISFFIGRYPVSIELLLKVFFSKIFPISKTWPDTIETIVFQIRLPRIVGAMLVGASLSVSGACLLYTSPSPRD